MRFLAMLCGGCLAAADPITVETFAGRALIVTAPAGADPAAAQRLGARMTVDWREAGVDDVAEALRAATGLNVVVTASLRTRAPLVTLRVQAMAAHDVLAFLDRMVGIRAGQVAGALVLSDQPVAGAACTVVYEVSDLLLPVRDAPGPRVGIAGAAAAMDGEAQPRLAIDELAGLVRQVVTP